MIGSATMEAMIEAGLSPEAMLAIVRGMEADRRPKDPTAAERQQRRRDKVRAEREESQRDVTRDDVTNLGFLDKKTQTQKINPSPSELFLPAREPVEILAEVVAAIVAAHLKRWRNQPPPPGVTDAQWTGFLEHRRAHPKGGKFTPRAFTLLCNKLIGLAEHGFPPGEMIDRAIERGWITVFEPKDFENGRTNGMGRHQSGDGLSPTTRAARDVFGTSPAGDERRVPQ